MLVKVPLSGTALGSLYASNLAADTRFNDNALHFALHYATKKRMKDRSGNPLELYALREMLAISRGFYV